MRLRSTQLTYCLLLTLLTTTFSVAKAEEKAITPKEGVTKLFNGKNLDGLYIWIRGSENKDPKKIFTVNDKGQLHISGDGYGGLITKQNYRDYHMVIEFKWGEKTWAPRKDRARDSGVLFHCHGADGGYGNTWHASIEAQIIEGGVGDILVLTGKDPKTGELIPTSMSAEIAEGKKKIWKKGGKKINLSSGRIDWWGRDPNWADKINFRGKQDVESKFGEWTRMDVICKGDKVQVKVNGVVVNAGFECKPSEGKLLVQTECAEMFVRKWVLYPLGKAPAYKK